MHDIEVFILTRNRADFLKKSVESLLNQTHKIKITVMDNCSTDATEQYINEFMKTNSNLHYFKHSSFVEFEDNLASAQKLASADYVIFFHDDDVLHPQYIEIAYQLVNKYENVDLICSFLTTFSKDEEINFHEQKKINYIVFDNKSKFTDHVYGAFFTDNSSIMFPNIIYKTQNIKNLQIHSALYGKIADKPFVINSLKDGKCIQIRNCEMLFYRIHDGQDSANKKNGPFPFQIINHNKIFKNVLNKQFWTRIKFNVFSCLWMTTMYKWGSNDPDKKAIKKFLKEACENSAINNYAYYVYTNFFYKRINKFLLKIYKIKDKNLKEQTLILKGN